MSVLTESSDVAEFAKQTKLTFESGFRQDIPISYCDYHCHPFIEIVMHSENRGTCYLEGGAPATFEPGSFIIHPPYIRHAQRTESAGSDLCILVASSIKPPPVLNRLLHVAGGRHPWLAADVMALLGAARKAPGLLGAACDHRAAALLMQLLDCVDQPQTPSDNAPGAQLAREADRVIVRDYGALAGVGELADRLCVSASYLRHVYKQHHGIGVKQRLIQVRLDHACDLLVGSTLPVKTIAAVCGFENDRYFSAAFKAAIGSTAGEYRRRLTA